LEGKTCDPERGMLFIKSETSVEHPNADLGFVSLVLVAHFV
jgi:hypothetical protein